MALMLSLVLSGDGTPYGTSVSIEHVNWTHEDFVNAVAWQLARALAVVRDHEMRARVAARVAALAAAGASTDPSWPGP